MKYLIVICVIFSFISQTASYVVATTKDVENTTVSQNRARNESEHNYSKDLMRDEGYIYLEDVIFALKHQNWTDGEKPCLEQTLRLIYNLQNSTLWAVWEWDSTSSEPEGILFGNQYHLGNYDECMSPPWYETNPELRTQYCLAEITLERYDKKKTIKRYQDEFYPYGSALNYIESRSKFQRSLNKLTWGACVPESCSPSSVVRLLEIMLAHSYLGTAGLRANVSVTEECQTVGQRKEYNGLFYAFVGTMGSLLLFVLICTYLNSKVDSKMQETSIGRQIIKACCLKNNFKILYKKQESGLEVLNGIRFLSMCVVVVGHQYGMVNGGPVSNGFKVDESATTLIGMLFLHDDIVVDSFFFLSGFLTARGLSRLKELPNLFILFLRRYIRLLVAYAVVIFFTVSVYPYIGDGPLWNRTVKGERDPCLKNWWLSFLMVGNYVNTDNLCLVISWYIPCDFHFSVITIVLYWLYKRLPGLGSFCVIIVTIAAVIVPGVINYIYKLPAVQLFTYEFLTNPRSQTQFHVSYIKSHNRYAPYLIGFFYGYYYATRSASGRLGRISWKWSVLGAFVSIVAMFLMMLSGPALVWASYGLLVDAIYAALNRPIWTISLGLLVFCCSLGKVPIVNSFLGWSPWLPLSRLVYGLYVTHALIIARNVHVIRNPQHTDHLILMNSTVGVIVWGCVASLAIWLVAESPINNLFTLCLKPRLNLEKTEENPRSVNDNKYRSTVAVENKGYLPENLPANIRYSSKI